MFFCFFYPPFQIVPLRCTCIYSGGFCAFFIHHFRSFHSNAHAFIVCVCSTHHFRSFHSDAHEQASRRNGVSLPVLLGENWEYQGMYRPHPHFHMIYYNVWLICNSSFFVFEMVKRGAGIAQQLERQTHDWKVRGLSPCRTSGRIFFSGVNFLCWLLSWYLYKMPEGSRLLSS